MRKEESVEREVAASEEVSMTTGVHNHGEDVMVHVDGSHGKARLEREYHEGHEADEDHCNNGKYEDDEEYYEDDEDFYDEGEDEQWDEVSLGPPSSPNILREAPLPSLNFTPNANPTNPSSASTKAAKQKNWLHRLPPSTPIASSSPQPEAEDIDNTFPRTGGGRPLNAPLPAILDGPRTGRPSSPGYQTPYSKAGFAAASTSSARFASLARTRPDEFVRLQREGMIDDRGEPTAKWNEHLERGRKRKRTGASASSSSRSKRKAKDDGASRTV
ncbi:hypothetical protein BU24DRAFT_422813 [Aaosphaeria arxii CBS 175.79]|uniref:Uncharacterized protein n=1 Tax=Aaosphaeria arxii CBS 175.79 TaxID=1450172 RepID=A0A6A5XT51_9PLEO|nr:uncharacterized protein BU24DRAFT_422813 [Aaosphaeria arxii CBS 175.79]KAF2016468.1 hypothetical protein BU24DRAFT_422813 [Aaosphaeria arxii CBS 175.79]